MTEIDVESKRCQITVIITGEIRAGRFAIIQATVGD